ncbi:MAG: ChbG/HpnK family deacetylase [Clostridia bacterium]|nr:ChbG/HpnK family deacetylase [Clostridia bacterium]
MSVSQIIINADDFGLSESANRAIADAFDKGLISNTTMLANGKAFDEAVVLANKHGFCDKVGIHFNLTQGIPLTDDIKYCATFCENGKFHNRINRLKLLNESEKTAVYKELSAQVKKLKNAGFIIDHADSHHHIHTALFISPIVLRICRESGINKIRLHRNTGAIPCYKKAVKNIYNKRLVKKGFYTTGLFGSLKDIDSDLPPDIEIMVHPDYDKNNILIDRRNFENGTPAGVPLLSISDKFGVELISYGDL